MSVESICIAAEPGDNIMLSKFASNTRKYGDERKRMHGLTVMSGSHHATIEFTEQELRTLVLALNVYLGGM